MNRDIEIEILDPVSRHSKMSIQVAVVVDGNIRYCYFATPEGLSNYGNLISGTSVRVHYENSDLIIVSEITEELIESTIFSIHEQGKLYACTSKSD